MYARMSDILTDCELQKGQKQRTTYFVATRGAETSVNIHKARQNTF